MNSNEQPVSWPDSTGAEAKSHPILGAGLVYFGAPLWAYVVAGELTSAGFIAEGVAVLVVIIVAFGSAVLATKTSRRDSLRQSSLVTHVMLAALVASLLGVITVVGVAIGLQSEVLRLDVQITLLLLLVSILSLVLGSRLNGRPPEPLLPRKLTVALFGAATVVSLIAAIHVIASS